LLEESGWVHEWGDSALSRTMALDGKLRDLAIELSGAGEPKGRAQGVAGGKVATHAPMLLGA
jgi:hypothetical protein